MNTRMHWILACAMMACVGSVAAQTAPITRTIVERADVSVPNREAIVARVEIAPGVTAGRHTHPGDEISYVIAGEADILVEGMPPRHVKAGDAFVIPMGVRHDARNTGTVPLQLLGVYVVEKGQPLATAAP